VNLWANMPNVTPGSFYSTSPPVVTERLVIVGGAVNDNEATTSPSGVIRAYDAYTGALVWNFDSKNPDVTEPIAEGEIYTENAPNSWSVSSYDPELGLVYLPMGNESPDQYGAKRGENTERFSAAVLALRAETGEVAWVFQTVHHDLWDYDVPAQPSLIDLTVNGEEVPALVQPTKQGDIFVLNRETGEPIIPVEERPAPQSGAVEGERLSPTQPASALSFRPEPLREADMWGATLIDQLYCRIRYRQLDYEGTYTPPSLNGTLHYPGNFGTFNWGGVAVDPNRAVMFAMPVYLAFTVKMVPRPDETSRVVTEEGDPIFNENFGAPYASEIGPFYSPLNLPCQRPPWGYVAAADLTTGEIVYRHVNGTVRDLSGPIPLPFEMGVPGIGGPIVTAGGVAFLSGTLDYFVRGYDLATGEEIWRARLPAGGQATPSTYLGADGRQYLVVVAGGHGSTGTKAGDSIIAYALPEGS
jgi:quinoprotein glucose dehydrogenase